MKIRADRNICIGAGMCVMTAAAVFDQDDQGIVVVLAEDVTAEANQRVQEAVNLCPSGALRTTSD